MKLLIPLLTILLPLSAVAAAEQKMLCEHSGDTEVIYLRGDGEDVTWQWNEKTTIREAWSDDKVLWMREFEEKLESTGKVWYSDKTLFAINRYTGNLRVSFYATNNDSKDVTASGICRPAPEKLF